MPKTRTLRINQEFVTRTQKSVDAETSFYRKVTQESNHSYKPHVFEKETRDKTDSYSSWWISEKGNRAKLLVEAYYENTSSQDACYVNVYDKSKRMIVKYKLKDVLEHVFKNKSETRSNKYGQVRFWEDLYLSSDIFDLLKAHHQVLEEGTSVC